ncbi:MAG: Hpt domain-containing protein, partial [Planctomycetota bacterium]|nr:Hpt domain-containing protein [Planctomycetota bacterium]
MLDDPELLQYFIEEGTSLIKRYKAAVKGPLCDEEQTKDLFVVLHTLKGTASALQLETLQASSRLLEQMLLPLSRSGSTLRGDPLRICQEALGPIQTIVEGAFTGEVINDPKWVKELEASLRLALDKSVTPSEPTKLTLEKEPPTPKPFKKYTPESSKALSQAVTAVKIDLSGQETVAAPLPKRQLEEASTGQTTRFVEVRPPEKESASDFWGDRYKAEPIFDCQFHISKDCPLL